MDFGSQKTAILLTRAFAKPSIPMLPAPSHCHYIHPAGLTPRNEPIDLKVKKNNPYLQSVQFPDLAPATTKETAELMQEHSAQEQNEQPGIGTA